MEAFDDFFPLGSGLQQGDNDALDIGSQFNSRARFAGNVDRKCSPPVIRYCQR